MKYTVTTQTGEVITLDTKDATRANKNGLLWEYNGKLLDKKGNEQN